MEDLVRFTRRRLEAVADPANAAAMAAYMKTDMPFYGVASPARAPILRDLVAAYPIATRDDYRQAVLALWTGPHREEKYLAIGLARAHPRFISLSSVRLYRKLIVGGAWWDLVDEVAIHLVGRVLRLQRSSMAATIERWVDDRHLWIRRTAILSQIGHKRETDARQLLDHCLRRAAEPDFFIRKAIGWALRDYARTDPVAVRDFLAEHGSELSGLSFREAAKHLDL